MAEEIVFHDYERGVDSGLVILDFLSSSKPIGIKLKVLDEEAWFSPGEAEELLKHLARGIEIYKERD